MSFATAAKVETGKRRRRTSMMGEWMDDESGVLNVFFETKLFNYSLYYFVVVTKRK